MRELISKEFAMKAANMFMYMSAGIGFIMGVGVGVLIAHVGIELLLPAGLTGAVFYMRGSVWLNRTIRKRVLRKNYENTRP